MAVKKNPKELAQQAALAGDVVSAIKQLEALLDGGDAGAAASLAEIAAFQGRWPDVLRYAYTFLRKPTSVYATINVFDAMSNLIALAGLEKRAPWPEILGDLEQVRAHLLAAGDLTPNASGANRFDDEISQLIELARSGGKAEYTWDWASYNELKLDEDEREKKYEAAVAELLSRKKKPWKNDVERNRQLFALAAVRVSYRSAVRLYDEIGLDDLIIFTEVAFTASALARAARPDDAWKVIEKKVSMWWPVDFSQVLPLVLFTDSALRALLTPERCEWVLHTPRGAAAVPPKPKKK